MPGTQAAGAQEPGPREIQARKRLGALILLLSFSTLLFGFLFLPVALVVGVYLRKNRGYHPVADLVLVLTGILFYTTHIPLFALPPLYFRIFLLNFTLSNLSFAALLSLGFIEKILILTAALSLFGGDLRARLGPSFPSLRGSFPRAIPLTFAALVIIPLLLPVGAATGPEGGWSSGGCPPSQDAFGLGGDSITVTRDLDAGLWSYHVTARNRLDRDATVTRVTAQKPCAGLPGILNLISRTETLGPPFGPEVEVTGGDLTGGGILVRPGETAVIRISSAGPIYSLGIEDSGGCRFERSFLAFTWEMPDYDISGTPAPDPRVQIVLTDMFPPGSDAGKTVFPQGQTIYTGETGLPVGTAFGFQLRDSGGKVLIPAPGRTQDFSRVKSATGPETAGAYNHENDPLEPGSYTVELIRLEGARGYIVARTNLTVLSA